MADESNRRAPVILVAGAAVALLLVGGLYLASRWTSSPAPVAAKPLPMGPKEQAYAQQIHFSEPKMSRAANFLNQEVTFIFGSISNDGESPLRQVEITLAFQDPFKQVILRDKQRLIGPNAEPLGPHQHRDFQLNYETLPSTWAQTYPTIQITGLDLQ